MSKRKVNFNEEDYGSKPLSKQTKKVLNNIDSDSGPNILLELMGSNKKIFVLVLLLIYFLILGIGKCFSELFQLNWHYIISLSIWLSIVPIKTFVSWLKNRKK
jgi:hypothetical protein